MPLELEKVEGVETAAPVIKNMGSRDLIYAKSVKNAVPVIKNRPPKKPVIARNGKRVDDWRIVEARLEKIRD